VLDSPEKSGHDATGDKRKNKLDFIKMKNSCASTEPNPQSKKATQRMGENYLQIM